MNTVMVACQKCGKPTMTNAAEDKILCDLCLVDEHAENRKAAQIPQELKELQQKEALLRELVESGEVNLPKKIKKEITPEDVLRALVKRPELLRGVVKLTCPTNLEDCVEYLLATVPQEDLADLKREGREDLIRHHHGFGTYLRNSFRLWARPSLVKTLCVGQGEEHPDTASMVIMKALWSRLQDMDLE